MTTPRPVPAPPKKREPSEDTKNLTKAIDDLIVEGMRNVVEKMEEPKPRPKRPPVKKEHLTASPFREHEGMRNLQKELKEKNPQPVKRKPRRPQAKKSGEK